MYPLYPFISVCVLFRTEVKKADSGKVRQLYKRGETSFLQRMLIEKPIAQKQR